MSRKLLQTRGQQQMAVLPHAWFVTWVSLSAFLSLPLLKLGLWGPNFHDNLSCLWCNSPPPADSTLGPGDGGAVNLSRTPK